MPNTQKPITFMPEEDIRKWYDSLEAGRRTKILNTVLRCYTVVEHHSQKIYGVQVQIADSKAKINPNFTPIINRYE